MRTPSPLTARVEIPILGAARPIARGRDPVYGDQAYRGQGEVIAEHAPKATDFANPRTVTAELSRRSRYRNGHTAMKSTPISGREWNRM